MSRPNQHYATLSVIAPQLRVFCSNGDYHPTASATCSGGTTGAIKASEPRPSDQASSRAVVQVIEAGICATPAPVFRAGSHTPPRVYISLSHEAQPLLIFLGECPLPEIIFYSRNCVRDCLSRLERGVSCYV